jgi:hypothetical protein
MADLHPELFREAGGTSIAPDAVRELYNRTGGDYANFINESQKLLAYAGGTPIDLKIVATMVSPKLDDDAFHLSNALTRGDIESALRIYRDLKVHSGRRDYADQPFGRSIPLYGHGPLSRCQRPRLRSNRPGDRRLADAGRYHGAKSLSDQREASLLRIQEQLYQLDYEILSGHQDPEFAFQLFLANFAPLKGRYEKKPSSAGLFLFFGERITSDR